MAKKAKIKAVKKRPKRKKPRTRAASSTKAFHVYKLGNPQFWGIPSQKAIQVRNFSRRGR